MTSLLTELRDDTFEREVLQADQPVLVDYWAPWCGPCRMLMPIVEQVAEARDGEIKFAKLNVDDNADTTAKYGIRGVPTLMLFRNGDVIASKSGVMSKAQLDAFLDENLA